MSFAVQLEASEAEKGILDWTGQSGRHYRLMPDSLPGFQLSDNHVHVLVCGDEAVWAGSAGEVVNDPHSRARFRAAMERDVVVYRLEPTPEADVRAMVAWDIVNGASSASMPLRLVG